MRTAIAAAILLSLSVPASAQTSAPAAASPTPASPTAAAVQTPPPAFNVRTTRDLVALCNTPQTDPNYPGAIGLCVGYGSGVLDYHLRDTAGRPHARRVCLPASPPTRGEARQMFVSWAQNNDQYMDEPAVNGVMRFLITTFPCHK